MKRILYILYAGLLAGMILAGACEKVVYPPIEIPEGISYSEDVQPIFDAKCVNCHNGGIAPNLTSDVSYGQLINGGYINTNNPSESKLMQKLYGTHDSRATETEKQIILQWITEGALDN